MFLELNWSVLKDEGYCIHWKALYFTLAVRALKDWIVWVEWILHGLRQMWITFGCNLHTFIQLHWIEWPWFAAFDLTLYVLVDLRSILVSKPLPNGVPNGLTSTPAWAQSQQRSRGGPDIKKPNLHKVLKGFSQKVASRLDESAIFEALPKWSSSRGPLDNPKMMLPH